MYMYIKVKMYMYNLMHSRLSIETSFHILCLVFRWLLILSSVYAQVNNQKVYLFVKQVSISLHVIGQDMSLRPHHQHIFVALWVHFSGIERGDVLSNVE